MPNGSPREPHKMISLRPKALLASVLALACFCSLGMEAPATWAAPPAPSKDKKPKLDPALKGLPITELAPDEAILHALNRLAYGPRPGDVEKVRQMGLASWIDLQLKPNLIDDHSLDARLENLPTLEVVFGGFDRRLSAAEAGGETSGEEGCEFGESESSAGWRHCYGDDPAG